MTWTAIRLLSLLLLAALAVIFTSAPGSVASKGLVTYNGRTARHDVYFWKVGKEEGRRLTALLHHHFDDLAVEGTYVTSAPQACSHCGKQTEFADWVYTALERNVHSPEFIAQALKNGTSAENVYHDVYCSRCGHLTDFRDPFGTEGRAPHIAHAAVSVQSILSITPSAWLTSI
ncbi:hypothetical protein C8T65DRAFT_629061 [Cerioporus squamosus]|nr:hypothetical protein C8T65DRAFT_629061 [Cerioporus squamosus]